MRRAAGLPARQAGQGAGLSAGEGRLAGGAAGSGVFVCHCGANIGRVVNVPVAGRVRQDPAQRGPRRGAASSPAPPTPPRQISDIDPGEGAQPRGGRRLHPADPRAAVPRHPARRRASTSTSSTWPTSGSTAPGSTPRRRKRPPRRPRTSSACRWRGPCHLEPLQEFELPVNKAALVVGGGVAGMTCALSLAEQGLEVYLVEKEPELGGMARRIHYTLEGLDVQAYLRDLIGKVYRHPSIHVYTDADHHRGLRLRRQLRDHGEVRGEDRGDQARRRHHRHRRRRVQAHRVPLRAGRAGHDPARAGGADRRRGRTGRRAPRAW